MRKGKVAVVALEAKLTEVALLPVAVLTPSTIEPVLAVTK